MPEKQTGDLFTDPAGQEPPAKPAALGGAIPVGGVLFTPGDDTLEKVTRAVDYLRYLWPEMREDTAARWARGFSGGFTDRDFRRGCWAAKESKRLGKGPPTCSEFRRWCMNVTFPKQKASPKTARKAVAAMREKLAD